MYFSFRNETGHKLLRICVLCLLFIPSLATASGTLSLSFTAGPYEMTTDGAAQRIIMEGFGLRPQSGKPLLPARTELYMLPPGSVVTSLDITGEDRIQLDEACYIRAAGPRTALSATPEELAEEWKSWESVRNSTYSSNSIFPQCAVEITAAGSLREYSYVAVTFYPFAYYPRSGILELCRYATADLYYETETSGLDRIPDPATATRAAELFSNYEEMHLSYPAPAIRDPEEESFSYVILTDPSLEAAVEASSFMDWKSDLGFNPRIILTTDSLITGQSGVDRLEQIRNFLREYYQCWGIDYLLIVGNFPTVPMRYCWPDPDACGKIPTDHYFADLSMSDALSWNRDGDSYIGEYDDDLPDFLAEVSVGRIPTNDTGRITYTLNKIVDFEQDTGSWKDNALHAGPICFHENMNYQHRPFREGALCMDMIETAYMNGFTVSHYSEYDGLVQSSYPWQPICESSFTEDWQNGAYGIVNWVSHGYSDSALRLIWTWDDGDGVFEQDEDIWNYTSYLNLNSDIDDDHPCILNATSCNIGNPETDCLGIALLTEPGFGASAGVISFTREASVAWWWPDEPGGAEELCLEFNHYLLDGPDGPERVGDALYKAQFFCHTTYSWNDYKEYKDLYGQNLYGDPSMERSGIPTSVESEYSTVDFIPIVCSASPNPFTLGTSIRFCLNQAGPISLRVYDAAGRLVNTLVDGPMESGDHVATWAGNSPEGDRLESGLYLIHLTGAFGTCTCKAVMIN